MFCWWLHEHAAVIGQGGTPGVESGESESNTGPETAPDPAALILWSMDRQHRWPQPFKGGVATLRMPLRECLDGRSFDDLRGAVRDELGETFAGPRYLQRMLRELRRLGLIDERDGRFVTTDAGEQLLESEPPDPLIEALIIRVLGFAHLLQFLREEPRRADELSELLAQFVPGEGGTKLWHRLALWAAHTGLLERVSGGLRQLTPLGREWAARLPTDLPAPAEPQTADDTEDEEIEVIETTTHPDFAAIWEVFETRLRAQGFVFSRSQVRALHAAWVFHDTKRFAVISGLSGTGKTQLLLRYATIVCELMGLEPSRHIALVPVRPDWRDPTGLLGYFNALHAEPTFQVEPALRLVLRASRHPRLPWFLILDEMNLARVERYFAPFLSTMETGESLQLHAELEPVNGVPAAIPWPANLRVGGTVNMDETTHPFSDKVLDRAFTLEFWEVDLDAFLARRPGRTPEDAPVEEALKSLQALLRPIRRHVGYRTAGEVVDWVAAARGADSEAPVDELIDQALFSKVLPRLRGTESSAFTEALEALHKACTQRSLRRCAAKVESMRARLLDTGITSFWS